MLILGLAALVFCIDRLSKVWVLHHLLPGETIPLLPQVFHLTRVHNTGAAFSLFHQYPSVLTLITSLLLVLLCGFIFSRQYIALKEGLGYGFILGGALGNLYDRIGQGSVTDFLDFRLIHYPIFNGADSFIFVGVVLLLMHYVKEHYQPARS